MTQGGTEFKLKNGKPVNDVERLLAYVEEISKDKYSIHSAGSNDFSQWARNHGNEKLAKKLDKSTNRKETIAVLKHFVNKQYEEKAEQAPEVNDDRPWYEIVTDFGKFVTPEFIYGLITGLFLALIVMEVLS